MKSSIIKYRILLVIGTALLFTGCKQVVLRVEKIPENTPEGAPIYVSGNFNLWDPGDASYIMSKQPDGTYLAKLPRTLGNLKYKYTRGDWSTVEVNQCGGELDDRAFFNAPSDTINDVIECWIDLDPIHCDSVTIVITPPKETKTDENIKIAGNFNAWNPQNDKKYTIKKDSASGKYLVKIPRITDNGKSDGPLSFKITRDSSIPEVDKFGSIIEEREFRFEKGDTTFIQVDNWKDLVDPALNQIVIILHRIPASTPPFSKIYLVGNFNNWDPGDPNYVFEKNSDGTYQIAIPRKKYGLSFKITRGNWSNEAADGCGNKWNNQDYNYSDIDTLNYTIANWADRPRIENPDIKLTIVKVPENTPQDAKLYLAGDINLWQPNDAKYKFTLQEKNTYVLIIPRERMPHEFKITRGSWANQEVDSSGMIIQNRNVANCVDSLTISIARWYDQITKDEPQITIIIRHLPESTPKLPSIYIAGEFNHWNPGDRAFELTQNTEGYYQISLPARWLKNGFKFTRGNWRTVEATNRGRNVSNRVYTGNDQVLEIAIQGWKDRD